MSIFSIVLFLLLAAQVYWVFAARRLLRRRIPSRSVRLLAGSVLGALYLGLMAYNFGMLGRGHTPIRLTPGAALLSAPFLWWAASSLVAFLIVILLTTVKWTAIGALKVFRRGPAIESPGRRVFLARTAGLVTGAPFVAGAYGLFYGRLNLETTHPRIVLPRLPRSLQGFRIAQLSDIHIGPFMPEDEIRKYVEIANAQKADLVVLTGDFVTTDPTTQDAVVAALSGLKAPFGVFGSLGNHDGWARVENSITRLFAEVGIRILRDQRVSIGPPGATLNLMGVDFQSLKRFGPSEPVIRLLDNIESLMRPDQVNILLSHNPDTFDRAAEVGIDLSLAGHTHGGQAALEFISPEIAPSRLVTPYVSGLFQKPGGQLYVNRGIGTIGVPIRIGAPPEISIFELTSG